MTTTTLVPATTQEEPRLALEPRAPIVTSEQRDLVRRTYAKDATEDEFRMYLFDCARLGVHPMDRQLHFTKRSGKYTPITSIDLMRARAADTGEYVGNDEYVFTGTPGGPDFTATARVWRLVHGQRAPFTRTARWSEFCPAPPGDHMYKRMPHVMLGKCAEAQALRAGFPRQLHGLYAAEELAQAEADAPAPVPPAPTGPITAAQRKALIAHAAAHGWGTDDLKRWLEARGFAGTQAIRQHQLDDLRAALEEGPPPLAAASPDAALEHEGER